MGETVKVAVAMQTLLKSIALLILTVGSAIFLQGCGGCDEEAVKKCVSDYAATTFDLSGKAKCEETYGAALDKYTTCLTDAGCLDDDKQKKALDDAKAAMKTACDALAALAGTGGGSG